MGRGKEHNTVLTTKSDINKLIFWMGFVFGQMGLIIFNPPINGG
jgi:hypothetical protein